MRNLILFVVRFNAFILFFLLEGSCVFLIVQNNQYHQAGFFNSSNYISGIVYSKYNSLFEYLHLRDVNDKLMNENAWLRSQLPSTFYDGSYQVVKVKDSLTRQAYTYIPGKVIHITTN